MGAGYAGCDAMSFVRVESPEDVFFGWRFKILRGHYPIFGLRIRTYAARKLPANGSPLKNSVYAEIHAIESGKTHYNAWSHSVPFVTSFRPGDGFYDGDGAGRFISVKDVLGQAAIEICHGETGVRVDGTLVVSCDQLVEILRNGLPDIIDVV